jgi:hypothetical protein
MHGMLKRAAASAIPALLGLAVSPANAMAASHADRAAAGPARGGREVHEHLAQRPRSGTIQGHRAGITRIAKTTADTFWSNGTDAEFAATPAIPDFQTFPPAFTAVPVHPDGGIAQRDRFTRAPGSVVGAPANGIIAYGNGNKILGNHIAASAGSGINVYHNLGAGNGIGAVNSP